MIFDIIIKVFIFLFTIAFATFWSFVALVVGYWIWHGIKLVMVML